MILAKCKARLGNDCPGNLEAFDGLKLVMAGGHCHAPACISIELYNDGTGEQLICWNEAVYGEINQESFSRTLLMLKLIREMGLSLND